ncbi:MAG: type II secretion system F family protein [Phycisphaerae bacterium]
MPFRYQAIDAQGRNVTDVIEAASAREAADLLRDRRLFVTRLDPTDQAPAEAAAGAAGETQADGKLKEVVFFTQQMSMLIRSGARVVQALSAVEIQCQRPAWRKVVATIRMDVEEGRPFSTALARFPRQFSPVYVNMVAAGEASGNMGLAFERLVKLMRQQQEIRNRVVGALAYPAVLVLLCVAVLIVLFTFILPRFAEMFATVGVELPMTTRLLIDSSRWVGAHWIIVLSAIAAGVAGVFLFLRSPRGRRTVSRLSVRLPIFGKLVRNIVFARMCRVWGQLLDSKVGLLDAVQLTQDSTTSLDFRELLGEVVTAITEGKPVSTPLLGSWLVPRTFSAAVVTGEESGKLADALLFVAACLEEENTEMLGSLSKIIEPLLLSVMGLIVGTVAISLFMPMFDLATIAGK